MLKALERSCESQYDVISTYLSKVYNLPFVLAEEKSNKNPEKVSLDQDRCEIICSIRDDMEKSNNTICTRQNTREQSCDISSDVNNNEDLSSIQVGKEHDYADTKFQAKGDAVFAYVALVDEFSIQKSMDGEINTSDANSQSSVTEPESKELTTDHTIKSSNDSQFTEDLERRRLKYSELCLKGISICLDRCSFSYKSIYRLASTLYNSSSHKVNFAFVIFDIRM